MKRLLLVVLAGCGGAAPLAQPTPVARTCEARWLTLEDDVVDLVPTADGLVWLGWEYGGLAAVPWGGMPRPLQAPDAAYVDARGVAVTSRGIVYALGDGSLWRAAAATPATKLATLGEPTQLGTAGDSVIVAARDGIHRVYPNGDHQRLFDEEVWVMTLDERAVYAQAGARVLRIPLDGTMPETLARDLPSITSMLRFGDDLLVTTKAGVSVVRDGKLAPYAPLEVPTLIWNLRSAGGRVYFTAGNLVYTVRGGAAVPVAIAHELIGDLEVDGPTLHVSAREYTGVAAICHDPDGAPVELATPELACGDGETEADRDALSISCNGPDGERAYALAYHASGTRAWEHGRDGVLRGWYADGTPRDEHPAPQRAGHVRRFFADGSLREEGDVDEEWRKHGAWTELHPDGSTAAITTWEHGQRR